MASGKRTRGPNRRTPWARVPEHGLSVLRLALDAGDPLFRRRLEGVFSAAFAVRRALQREARTKVRAFRAAAGRDRRSSNVVRERLGLTRAAFERAAYRHLDRAPHLRRFVTKALAMHLADSVWTSVERHLFPDASGRRQGLLHAGRWFDFTRLPGRARSHTTPRKWETFRLHGTLPGHRAEYAGPGGFFQPRRMRPIRPPDDSRSAPRGFAASSAPRHSWWSHDGPLVVVFTGLSCGDLVLPVRLPAAPSNQAILDHHLADPEKWHKVDLVRRRDPGRQGGWRYEAHLMVLAEPYVSPATVARREKAARETAGRQAGIDVNVSNVTIASHLWNPHHQGGEDFRVTRIARDGGERETARRRAKRERRRQRALERARRAANPEQYLLTPRQQERASRREAAGLPPQPVIPRGMRRSRSDGKPTQAYRRDRLSARCRRERAAQARDAASAAQARRDHARRVAAELVLRHGFRAIVEDSNLSSWARQWGRSLHAFAPGTLLAAMRRESAAVAKLAGPAATGTILRASTRTTALSRHCLCGERVPKPLGQRVHSCPACGLAGDRDAVSATLASFVGLTSAAEPRTASVDFEASRAAGGVAATVLLETLHWNYQGRQDAPLESTAHPASDGSSVEEPGRTSRLPVTARRTAGTASYPTPDESGTSRTTPKRVRTRTSLSRDGTTLPPLRDSS